MPGFCQRYSSFRSNTDFRGQKKVCEYTRAAFLLPGSQTRSAVAALRILQLLLYLCSEEPDMPQIEHPQKRRTISGGVRSPKEPQVWDVGVRVSNAIRNYKNHERTAEKEMASVQGAHSSPRPHVRAAHWHTFWVGPRSAKFPDRKPIIRWLPPIPIGMDWRRELPTNIHIVLEN